MTYSKFADLGLSGRLLRALNEEGYDRPTPIQAQAIPALLEGADLLGIAQTGTGKTAAFTLPLLDGLARHPAPRVPKRPRALILAPTRELVIQISESIKTYGRHVSIRCAVVMGGVSMRPQVDMLRRGVDVLVATPGRLLDLVNQRHLDLRETGCLILDEADRMLDMGFVRDVRKIVATMPQQRQTVLFSATMPSEIARLAAQILEEPERVEIASKTVAVERIEQCVHHVNQATKRDRLVELLADSKLERVVVFTRTKHGADKVVKHLCHAGIKADALHGNKSQNARQKALERFRAGKSRVLVATDIASRGIDVDDVSHVINYELPNIPESYVHRIGRTARAGTSGIAISFCDASERSYLKSIERLIKRPLDVVGDGRLDATVPANENRDRKRSRPTGRRRHRHRRRRRRARLAA